MTQVSSICLKVEFVEKAFTYKISVTDRGTFKHQVAFASDDPQSIDFNDATTVREVGAGSVFKANEQGSYQPQSTCDTTTDAKTNWFCLMNTTHEKDSQFLNNFNFNTSAVLATTSVQDNLRVFVLVISYLGLGIVAMPRGAVLTADMFTLGYVPLFDNLGFPRCGQLNSKINPVLCGDACANVISSIPSASNPYADPYKKVIWDMSSPNGAWRLQFFDSGHMRFAESETNGPISNLSFVSGGSGYKESTLPLNTMTGIGSGATASITVNQKGMITSLTLIEEGEGYALNDRVRIGTGDSTLAVTGIDSFVKPFMFTTVQNPFHETVFPICEAENIIVTSSSQKPIEIHRDMWLLRNGYFQYTNGKKKYNMQSIDLQLVISDSGGLFLKKDYVYKESSHPMVQSRLGPLDASDPLNANVGNPDGDNIQHWLLGEGLTCYSQDLIRSFDATNGTALAYTAPDLNDKRYILWLSHWGLRLLYTSLPVVPSELGFEGCLWITPFYWKWFFSKGNPLLPISRFSNCTVNGGYIPNVPFPRGGLEYCGTFPKPTRKVGDKELIALYSDNKRYCFKMFQSGVCDFIDFSLNIPIWTSDSYQHVDAPAQCPIVTPWPPII